MASDGSRHPSESLASGKCSKRRFFLPEDLVAVPELVELDVEALSDGTHTGVSDQRPMIILSL